MIVAHLTGSPFFGGPERQMLGLALSLATSCQSVFLSFAEKGGCRPFLNEVRQGGFEGVELEHNTPHFRSAVLELASEFRRVGAGILCCHGYKADLLGHVAARRAGIPVIAVSRGWTWATPRVRFYEFLDRISLHLMDRVVCVSEGQARRVRRAGVPLRRISVIRNAIDVDRFRNPDPAYRDQLQGYFPEKRRWIVGAAGRLSPEKGFAVFVDAAARVVRSHPDAGFVLFGDGPLRESLQHQISQLGLERHFILAGFSPELDRYYPFFDLVVLPSHTEGLPNAALEAFAAGVPVVATAVGGTPEVVEDGRSGYLVPPGNPGDMATRILDLLGSEAKRQSMGQQGRQRVQSDFTFESQSLQYLKLFDSLSRGRRRDSWSATSVISHQLSVINGNNRLVTDSLITDD
jgi:glycosyltransferase involved in cell wall biosynthesis